MTWPGLWPGREHDLEVDSREAQPLAAGDRVLGLIALKRTEAGRHPAHDVREHRPLDLRAEDLRAGGARDRRDGADVVEVAVRDQDRLDLDAQRSSAACSSRSGSSPGSTITALLAAASARTM